jgi:hypothetical protein
MFLGHYSVAFAGRTERNKVPLWVLFVAVQLLDLLWAPFVFLGHEKVRIVLGITATRPLDLYYMPYTHSLIGAFVWSALAAFVYKVVRGAKASSSAALIVALAVLSHWILDLIVHRPDLPIYDDTLKVGLGLLNYRGAEFAMEIALLVIGIALYLKRNVITSVGRKIGIVVFGVVLILVQTQTTFGGWPLSSNRIVAITTLFASIAFLLEKQRRTHFWSGKWSRVWTPKVSWAGHFQSVVNRPFQFQKRSPLFISAHDETLSVALCVDDPDRAPFKINGWDPA